MSVPIEGSYGVRGIVVTSRVFGKDIAAIGIGERECVLVQGGQHVPTNPRSEGHSGLRSRISAYFVTVPDRHAQPCYLHAGHPLPVESPDILLNGHRYRHDPFLPERRLAATGRIRFELQLGNIQAAASRPLTSPGNDDDTGENHQPTLRKNTAEPVEQTLKQNNMPRVDRPRCGAVVTMVPWAEPGSRSTRDFESERAWPMSVANQKTVSGFPHVAWRAAGRRRP